jgi:hypothetical protein
MKGNKSACGPLGFSGNYHTGTASRCAPSCETRLSFQHGRAPVQMGKMSSSGWMQHFRKVLWALRTDSMASSFVGSNSLGFSSCGDTWRKEHVYAVSLRTIEYLLASLQAAVTAVDVNMLWHVWMPIVRSFDSLAIWRWCVKLNVMGHMLYNILDLSNHITGGGGGGGGGGARIFFHVVY